MTQQYFRFKTNVSLKLLPEWMLSVKPNPVWGKQPFLFWQHCNNWTKKRQTTQVALKCWSCATLVNSLFKSQKNIKDFQNTWKISRYGISNHCSSHSPASEVQIWSDFRLLYFSVVCQSIRTRKHWRRIHLILSSQLLVASRLWSAIDHWTWKISNTLFSMNVTRCLMPLVSSTKRRYN